MTRRRRRDLAAFGITTALVLATGFHRLLAGDLVFSRDTSRLLYPLKVFVVTRLRQGHLPLWYPYESLGTPCLAAGVTAVFHPLTWLAVVVGPLLGHALATLACLGLIAAGTWLLTRRLGASRPGAALAVVIALGGGNVVSTLDNQTFLWGASVFPLFVLGVLLAVRRPKPAPGMLLATAALAWTLFAGDFEAAYVFGLVGIATALLFGKGPPLRALVRVASACGLALALAGVQVLPSLSALTHIDRAHGLPWSVASRWSMHPLRIPELFLGDLLRYTSQGVGPDVRSLVVGGAHDPWQLATFVGIVPLVALALVAAGRRRRAPVAILCVTGGLLWLALGRYGGLYRLAFTVLPVWRAFRYPEKLLPLVQMLLAVVSGLAVTGAWRRPGRAARVTLAVAMGLALVAGGLALGAARSGGLVQVWLERARHGAVVGVVVAAELALTWAARQRRLAGRLAPVLAAAPVLLALAQLAPVDARLLAMTSGPGSLLTDPGAGVEVLRAQGLRRPGQARVTTYAATAIGLVLHDPDAAAGFAGRTLWKAAALAPDTAGPFGIETTGQYLPVVTPRYQREVRADPWRWLSRDAAIFNGRYAVVDEPTFLARGAPLPRILARRSDLGLVILEDPAALPRAFVTRPRFVPDGAAARAALATEAVARGQVAAVEHAPVAMAEAAPPLAGPVPATVVSYAPEHVVVQATAPAPGVLVLNDAFFPGWRVTVDGRPAPLLRANYLVRGVLLPAGSHRVVFTRPVPASLVAGAALSVLALAALALLWVRGRGGG